MALRHQGRVGVDNASVHTSGESRGHVGARMESVHKHAYMYALGRAGRRGGGGGRHAATALLQGHVWVRRALAQHASIVRAIRHGTGRRRGSRRHRLYKNRCVGRWCPARGKTLRDAAARRWQRCVAARTPVIARAHAVRGKGGSRDRPHAPKRTQHGGKRGGNVRSRMRCRDRRRRGTGRRAPPRRTPSSRWGSGAPR